MKIDKEKINSLIDYVANEQDDRIVPLFYAVSGSHLYRFADDESDVDVRGIHLVPSDSHLKIMSPQSEIKVNQGSVTDGFEDYEEVDFVSYELKTFGRHLCNGNFNLYEFLYSDIIIRNNILLPREKLQESIEHFLPHNLPRKYRGMAKSMKSRYIDDEAYIEPKRFLYTIKGLLAGHYVSQRKSIETDFMTLSQEILNEEDHSLVQKLVEAKQNGWESERMRTKRDMISDTKRLIDKLFDELEFEDNDFDFRNKGKHDEGFRKTIDEWMLWVRTRVEPVDARNHLF